MSTRTLLELNHDFAPPEDLNGLLQWAQQMRTYVRSGDKRELPAGVTFKHIRHHSDPCPFEEAENKRRLLK